MSDKKKLRRENKEGLPSYWKYQENTSAGGTRYTKLVPNITKRSNQGFAVGAIFFEFLTKKLGLPHAVTNSIQED